ncbi:exocyst complex subunit Sec15-like protein [Neolentinus lepideus HHB14362 ss-1]|uniref:Exocyst complex component SEC15 n=1 Tax=Neolentinus lepideus HHB14362 ss-1 TaxID=1314782 RepID=A0A165V8S0_9AGAM|nr:exocyst complex subunit Sec15-like protein [Neolentinus lepideus HHB14362 ss-1]
MPPRRRPQFTQENIDQQLQQIHLLDPQSSSENLEQLGPIIKQIHQNRQQEAYLRTVQGLIESKDAEIERICDENYQDFISSVSTLFTIKSYTKNLRERITTLDGTVAQVGHGLVEKKRSLLQSKKTAANLDEAIDNLQACLRVLDVVNRVGEMVQEGKYWSALRSLEDIRSMPPTSLSQTPFFQHLLSSLPSLRGQIKDAVTASTKQWLLDIRNVSGQVGEVALEAMDLRVKRWKTRRERDPMLRSTRVGSAVEWVTYEKTEFDALNNDKVTVDFKPLYQCIHIYTALDSLDDLRKSYQADRKAQSDLILPSPLSISALPALLQEISGYFIIETHVLKTTGAFRSERDVEELWDTLTGRLTSAIDDALRTQMDPDELSKVKELLISFAMTMEAYDYNTANMYSFILVLFERYAGLLEKQFKKRFDDILLQDDCTPMQVDNAQQRDTVFDVVWISKPERDELVRAQLPLSLPWSQSFYLCCQSIRTFVERFYQFVDGVSQHHRNIDEVIGKALDSILSAHISENIARRLATTSTLTQIAQMVTNLEHFQVACVEIEATISNIRTAQSSFTSTLTKALARITSLITSKLDDFFELSEYDWTPSTRESAPSVYLYELFNWLTTVLDSLIIKDVYKDESYRGAVNYIASCLMDFLTGRNVAMINENAISNILVDVDFLEEELKGIGRAHLANAFVELRSTTSIILSDAVQDYLVPSTRQTSYITVKPKRLQALLEKLAKFGGSCRDNPSREKGERRRREAEAVSRLFPGESR